MDQDDFLGLRLILSATMTPGRFGRKITGPFEKSRRQNTIIIGEFKRRGWDLKPRLLSRTCRFSKLVKDSQDDVASQDMMSNGFRVYPPANRNRPKLTKIERATPAYPPLGKLLRRAVLALMKAIDWQLHFGPPIRETFSKCHRCNNERA